jgi:hypothetical protein
MKIKKKVLKELGFMIIAVLLVIFSILIAGTFFEIWIKDYWLMALMALVFYLIIGFYRLLNSLARKYRDGDWNGPGEKNS